VTEAHKREQLAQGCHAALPRAGFEPATYRSQAQMPYPLPPVSVGGPNMNGEPRRGRGGRVYRPGGRRPYYGDCDGSVYVGSLPRTLRVSEFKAEVRDRNVQPLRVIWRGSSGYAFLGFRTMEDAEQALEALDGLHIDDHDLRLEMAKSSGGGGGGGRDRRRRRENPPRSGAGGDDIAASEDEE